MINELGDNTFMISDFKEGWQEVIVFKGGKRIATYDEEDKRKYVRDIFKNKKKTPVEDHVLRNAVHRAWASYDCPKHLDIYLITE